MNENITIQRTLSPTEIEAEPLLQGNATTSSDDHRTPESYVREWRVSCINEEVYVGNTMLVLPNDVDEKDEAEYEDIIKACLISTLEQNGFNALEISDKNFSDLIDVIYKGMTQGGFAHWGQNYLKSQIPHFYRPSGENKNFNIVVNPNTQSISITFSYACALEPLHQKDIEFRYQLQKLNAAICNNESFSPAQTSKKVMGAQLVQKLESLLEKAKIDKETAQQEIEALLELPQFSSEVVYHIDFNNPTKPKTISCSYNINKSWLYLLRKQKESISDRLPNHIDDQNLFNKTLFNLLETTNFEESVTLLKALLSNGVVSLEEVGFDFQKNTQLRDVIHLAIGDPLKVSVSQSYLTMVLTLLGNIAGNKASEYKNRIIGYQKSIGGKGDFEAELNELKTIVEAIEFSAASAPNDEVLTGLKNNCMEKINTWREKISIEESARVLRRARPPVVAKQSYGAIMAFTGERVSTTPPSSPRRSDVSISQRSSVIPIPSPSASPRQSMIMPMPATDISSTKAKKPLSTTIITTSAQQRDEVFDKLANSNAVKKNLNQFNVEDLVKLASQDKSGDILTTLIQNTERPVTLTFWQRLLPFLFKPKKDPIIENQRIALFQIPLETYLSILQSSTSKPNKEAILNSRDFVNKETQLYVSDLNIEPNFSNFLNLAILNDLQKHKAQEMVKDLLAIKEHMPVNYAKVSLIKKVLAYDPFFKVYKDILLANKFTLINWIEKCQDPELIGLLFKRAELASLLSVYELNRVRDIAVQIHAPVYRIDKAIKAKSGPTRQLSDQEAINQLNQITQKANATAKLLEQNPPAAMPTSKSGVETGIPGNAVINPIKS